MAQILIVLSLAISIIEVVIFMNIWSTHGDLRFISPLIHIPVQIDRVFLVLVKGIGIAIGILGLIFALKRNYRLAGACACISSVSPPLDLIMLIGGLFCLISREGKHEYLKSREER